MDGEISRVITSYALVQSRVRMLRTGAITCPDVTHLFTFRNQHGKQLHRFVKGIAIQLSKL